MPSTEWGAPISFGWELEGTSDKILKWYEPGEALLATIALSRSGWAALSFEAQSKALGELVTSGKWGTGALRWSNFVKRADAPPYVQFALKEEAHPRTWEINSIHTTTLTVEQLFSLQLEAARDRVADVDARAQVVGFHVHIVFDKPSHNKEAWNGYIASLFTLLNDYAALKDASNSNQNFTSRIVGNSPDNPHDVATMLDRNVRLDRELTPGQMGGPQKYNFVGLRDVYGDNKIGFEIRDGWTKNWDRFKSFVTRLVGHLGALAATDVHIKRRSPANVTPFSLVDHFQLHQSRLDAPSALLNNLEKEAERVLSATKTEAVTDPVTLYRRWSRAFIPWENHPSFRSAPAQRELIRAQRAVLCAKLEKYIAESVSRNTRLASAGFPPQIKIDAVNGMIVDFFAATKIHKYL